MSGRPHFSRSLVLSCAVLILALSWRTADLNETITIWCFRDYIGNKKFSQVCLPPSRGDVPRCSSLPLCCVGSCVYICLSGSPRIPAPGAARQPLSPRPPGTRRSNPDPGPQAPQRSLVGLHCQQMQGLNRGRRRLGVSLRDGLTSWTVGAGYEFRFAHQELRSR